MKIPISIRPFLSPLFLAASLISSIHAQTWQDISSNVPGVMSQEQFSTMASDGTRFYVLGDKGVFVSSDNGASFTAINAVAGGGPDLSQHTQRFIKFVNGQVWVGGGGFIASGQPAAPRLHRLTPGQTVWQASAGGLPGTVGEGTEDDLTYDPVSGNYFGTISTGTVYVSTDGGNNWLPRTNGLGGIGSPSSIVPAGGAVLTSRPLAGVLKTTDQGLNWSGKRSFGQDSIGNMIAQNGRLLITAGRTLHFSDNAGDSWNQVSNVPHGNSVLSGDGANVFALSRNNTAQEVIAYSASGGLTWHQLPRDGLPPIPTFSGYYVQYLFRHGDFLFLRGKTLNSSFLLDSTQLHRLDVSGFDFINDFQIVIQPQGKGLLVGQTHELEVYASGENLTYQWQRNGEDLAGKTSRTLLLENVQTSNSGDYTVLVKTGDAPAVPSAVATVTVFEREDGRWDPVFDQTDITAGGRAYLLENSEAIVVSPTRTPLAIFRIGADGARLQNFTANTSTATELDLSKSILDQNGNIIVSIKPNNNTTQLRRYNPSTFAFEASVVFGSSNSLSHRIKDMVEIPGKGYAIVGGFDRTAHNSVTVNLTNFAMINYDFSTDTTFPQGSGPNSSSSITSITRSPNGDLFVAGGTFTSWSEVATPRSLARIDPAGAVHAVNTGIAGNTVASFVHALDDGRILVLFGTVGARQLYALQPNGAVDPAFNVANHTITDIKSVAQQADGKIILVWNFTSFGGVTAAGYIRLNTDGSVDDTFFTATAFSHGHINDVTYDSRGYLYLSSTTNSNAFQGQPITGRGPVRVFAHAAPTVGGGGGFADWPDLASLPAEQRGPNARPANDGVDNLVKFALGIPPLQSATARLPSEVVKGQGDDEGFPVVSYIRLKNLTGLTIQVEVCADLDFAEIIGTTHLGTEDLGDGTERVTVRSNATFASLTTQFFRLKVTED